MDAIEADLAKASLSENITLTLKELLETKHLYQSITTSFSEIVLKKAVSGRKDPETKFVETDLSILYSGPWHCWELSDESKGAIYSPNPYSKMLAFGVPHVKLFCHDCDRIEPFNYVLGQEAFPAHTAISGASLAGSQTTTQVFVLSFLCQSCKGVPEVFLIRRQGNKLTLSGRSPIEHIDTPRFIPKAVAHFLSGAIVAHQSGQTLAGVFLIRVLIEQWVQSQAKRKGMRVDQALAEYIDGLPKDFKDRFPSLRTLYEQLSADIHSATGSPQLFDEAREQVIEHFDGRRLYKLE